MNAKPLFLALCLIASVAILATGCTSMPKVIRELKQDPATVEFKVVAPGWLVEFKRAWPTNLVARVPSGSTLLFSPDYLPPVPKPPKPNL